MRKIEVEAVDSVRRRLEVEVPQSEVDAQLERAYSDLRRTARVPGFRPGRAPRSLLERLYGDQVRADVIGKLIQDSCFEALQEQKIAPISQPQITTEAADAGGPLRYSAVVEVKPEVVAADYAGLQINRPVHRIEEEHVDRALRQLQESFAQLHPITDRSRAQIGDVATVDFDARVGDQTLQHAEGRLLEVVERSTSESVGAHLENAEIGSPVTFEVDFPPEHPDERIAGKSVVFTATVKSLATKELPELDDEFAKDHGECASFAELRQKVRERLEAAAARQADQTVRARVLEELLRKHEVEVPETMVERRTEALVEDILENMGQRRPPASQEEAARAQLRQEFRGQARDHVKAMLILEAIARQENLEVSDAELDEHIETLVTQMGPDMRDHVRAAYKNDERRAGLRFQLVQDRALDLVASKAQLQDVEPQQESC